LTEDEVKRRLWQWADVTALCLSLKEAGLRAQFSHCSDAEIQTKLKEHLAILRHLRLPKE
jgi:hypothetical protein